jgi:hypothetical protein
MDKSTRNTGIVDNVDKDNIAAFAWPHEEQHVDKNAFFSPVKASPR